MKDQQLDNLLIRADRSAPRPVPPDSLGRNVRLAADRRRLRIRTIRITAAAAVVVVVAATVVLTVSRHRAAAHDRQIAAMRDQISLLSRRTDAALNLLNEVAEAEQSRRRIAELQSELQRTSDPLETIDARLDATAAAMLNQAEHLRINLGRTDAAITTYKRVIILSPDSPAAEIASARLRQLQDSKPDSTIQKEI